MIQPINRDILTLNRKADPATPADLSVADDLRDTLAANADGCVGMAANMIGVNKAIIVFAEGDTIQEMFNPKILRQSGVFMAEEGCLSLTGTRPVKRCRSIKVQWQDRSFKPKIRTFTGWTAQIIQHEIDHLSGILI